MREMSYKVFMNEVERRLQSYSKEELQEILLSFASEEHTSKRGIFLARLDSSKRRGEKYNTTDAQAFIEEIEEFYQRIKDGEYCDGWGWDHEIHESRDFGDESWAEEMDEFLVEARELLLEGLYDGAEEAYQLLFSILEMGEEPGHLPGNPDIYSMLDEVLDEHFASYLQSVYRNASLEERPKEIYASHSRYSYFSKKTITWKDVVEVIDDPLPDYELFLKGWVAHLKDQGRIAHHLLIEALRLEGGITALLEFASSNATTYPEAYLDAIQFFKERGDEESLLSVIQEGLAKIPADYTARALVAESLAEIGRRRGKTNFIREGIWEAFYSSPSLQSILNLYTTAMEEGCFEEVTRRAQERIQALLQDPPSFSHLHDISRARASKILLAHALLLGGQDEQAYAMTQEEEGENPIASLFFSCSLLLLSKGGPYQETINSVWEKSLGFAIYLERGYKEKYQLLLGKIAQERPFSREKEEAYLTWSLDLVDRIVDHIVKNKQQSQYPEAAAHIVAMAETLLNRGEKSWAQGLVMMYRNRFPRHRAFLRELKEIVDALPIII